MSHAHARIASRAQPTGCNHGCESSPNDSVPAGKGEHHSLPCGTDHTFLTVQGFAGSIRLMPVSDLRLIQRCSEFSPQDSINFVPPNTRGIYVLLRRIKTPAPRQPKFDVVYIGMARGLKTGIRGRLISHKKRIGDEWTHFSVFEVWPNISETEIAELEGLFRHIYRKDRKAIRLNSQREFLKLKKVRKAFPWTPWPLP